MIAAKGIDSWTSRVVDDILIAGTTDHDLTPASLDAAIALLGPRWGHITLNSKRITDLGTLFNLTTVQNDSDAADSLTGGLGLDWFLIGLGDTISDKDAGGSETQATA